MSFKHHILQKIKMDRLTKQVGRSLDPSSDQLVKIDRDAMVEILSLGGYRHTRERFMDLYLKEKSAGGQRILVLDNEIALYRTSLDDVLLRKNPTLKEMISVRNAIKILKDSDVVISRKEKTLEILKQEFIDTLDLSHTVEDLSSIMAEGVSALEAFDQPEVISCLDIFCELLGYEDLSKPFKIDRFIFRGALRGKGDATRVGPVLIYDTIHNLLKCLEILVDPKDKDAVSSVLDVAVGRKKSGFEGKEAFLFLLNKTATDEMLGRYPSSAQKQNPKYLRREP